MIDAESREYLASLYSELDRQRAEHAKWMAAREAQASPLVQKSDPPPGLSLQNHRDAHGRLCGRSGDRLERMGAVAPRPSRYRARQNAQRLRREDEPIRPRKVSIARRQDRQARSAG